MEGQQGATFPCPPVDLEVTSPTYSSAQRDVSNQVLGQSTEMYLKPD